ncbi:PAS domain S-box protein [Polaribacter sp. IC066]|uniref:GAF domain-containing sensor histidine kinase n=1 Tax=Polaribacter sp. IC066 TaxID=57032 RepID=UPI0011BF4EC8|nr:ATP-binding protein [Polaribacter sp. IC066]TXD56545.1 PAS domain S-box protein [Polaribacter sp. IC066]
MNEQKKIEILERALLRQKKARKAAEQILEIKSLKLFNTAKELHKVNAKLEELLDEKTTQLKGIFENINDAYIVMDIDGAVIKMNDNAVHLFGYDHFKEKINVVNLIYQEDFGYAMDSFSELIEKGSFSNYTARVITKNREVKWVNINASVVYDKNNIPIAAQGIIRDITVQREKRLVLDMINNIMKSILGKEDLHEIAWEVSSSIADYLSTNDCVIYLVDEKVKTLEQIAAFQNRTTQGKQILNKVVLSFGEGIVGNVAKTGIAKIVSDTSKDKSYVEDDERRLSEITVPIINDGQVIAVIDAEHKNKNYFVEAHLKTIENIANLVSLQFRSAINLRERKKVEIKNRQLLKKLAKSNEELEEYAHIVSHDLKSPLRSISALNSWIQADNVGKFDAMSLQNFKDVDATLETMENLISNILEYSSISANLEINDDVDLNALIEDLKTVLFVPRNISINILNKLPIIRGDKTKFQQVFQNLISNAIKFIDKEKGFVNIDVAADANFYTFSISDNGIGIEKQHFDKIFKIFQSLNGSKDSNGIGLSIVKKIVDIYSGEVWLTSEVHKGTTFYFTLKK